MTAIEQVLSYSQNIANPIIDTSEWAKRKSGIPTFHSTEEITITLENSTLKQLYYEFLDSLLPLHLDALYQSPILDNYKAFFENSLSRPTRLPDGSVAPKGSKILRLFRYYISDPTLLRKVQDSASRAIQQSKISGYLHISTDPLDFLSMSNNSFNWTTCQSLDGSYRAATLSLAADSSTAIAYLSSKEPVSIPGFPFPYNNKKWRCLLHFDSERQVVFASRQYPFQSKELLNMVLSRLPGPWARWNNSYLESFNNKSLSYRYFELDNQLYPLEEVVSSNSPLIYNDLIHSPHYLYPYYSHLVAATVKDPVFSIGEPIHCVHCGEHLIDTDTMFCSKCEDKEVGEWCDCCGGRIYHSDPSYPIYGGIALVCGSCVSNTEVCKQCGDRVYANEINELGLCQECGL